MDRAEFYIEQLKLIQHPEGGAYKEVYRSTETISNVNLPEGFEKGDRPFCTSIYFLVNKGDFSAFHRIKSDESWNFYDGTQMLIYEID